MSNHVSPEIIEQIKTITAYYIGNPGPNLGQEHTCGGIKPVNGTPTLDPLFIIGSQYIYK